MANLAFGWKSASALIVASLIGLYLYPPARLLAEDKLNRVLYGNNPEVAAKKACKEDILDNANDPRSVEWVDEEFWRTRVKYTTTDGRQVYETRMELRAKNGFGALVKGVALCESGAVDGIGYVLSVDHQR